MKEPRQDSGVSSGQSPDFDRLAPIYRWLEWASFGPWLGWCRSAYLEDLLHSRRALILGDGDGRFTAALLRRNPAIEIDVVDTSAAMLLALVRRAGPEARRLKLHHADARLSMPDSPPYDLIVTHFFLDCLEDEELQSLAGKLRLAAAPSACWVLSEFAIPRNCFGALAARPAVWLLYRIFGWMTGLKVRKLPDPSIALQQAGFLLQKGKSWLGGLLISQIWRVDL